MAHDDDNLSVEGVDEPHKPRNDDHHTEFKIIPLDEEAHLDVRPVTLTWRSWLVVFITCFAVCAQVFVIAGAGQVISFIVRDIGSPSLAGWIVQGPLLMQSVLSPIVGRLSDVLDRKYLSAVPPLIAVVGSIVSAKATSMSMLVIGGILIGTTLSTIAIVHSIPSEVLPLKYRAISNGLGFFGGCIGGLAAGLGGGAVTNLSSSGWRWIFWIQVVLHGITSLGLFIFYWPPKNTIEFPKMAVKEYIWACDPIGSLLFIGSATLMLLGLNWAGGAFAWSDPHVAATISIGLALMVLLFIYEWKGRDDGLVPHVFFARNNNFFYSIFAFTVEGWVFYSAVNTITPAMVLHMDFESNSWRIAIRQLSFTFPSLFLAPPLIWWATRYKDLKSPLIATFTVFLAVCIAYAFMQPSWGNAHYALNVFCGVGQAGPLALLSSCVQFSSPHAYLSTATGLGYSSRAIGGAFGTAVLNAIINGRIAAHYAPAVEAAAMSAGLPVSSVPALLKAMEGGKTGDPKVVGATRDVWAAAVVEHREQYAAAYRLAWASIIPFAVLAIVAIALLKSVKDLMTEKVEATVERVKSDEKGKEEMT